MSNETIFFLQMIFCFTCVLIANRLGYAYLVALVSVMAVVMNLFVIKQFNLFGFEITGGNVLYANIFVATDLISEHRSRRLSHDAVMIGFFTSLFFLAISQFALWYHPNHRDFAHEPMEVLFGFVPRIVASSMVSYLIAQNLDIVLFHAIRNSTESKYLWLRNNVATMTAQLVDTVVFSTLAFAGAGYNLFDMILFTYLVKVFVALCDTPFVYLSYLSIFRPTDRTGENENVR